MSLSCPAWCVLVSKDSGFAFPVALGMVWEGGLGHVSTGGMKCHHEVSMFSMRKPCWCSAGRSPHFVCLTEFLQCFKEAVSSPVYTSSHTIIHSHAAVLKASPPTLDHPGTGAGSQAPSYQPLCFPEGGDKEQHGRIPDLDESLGGVDGGGMGKRQPQGKTGGTANLSNCPSGGGES